MPEEDDGIVPLASYLDKFGHWVDENKRLVQGTIYAVGGIAIVAIANGTKIVGKMSRSRID